jgi:hypothetical protein
LNQKFLGKGIFKEKSIKPGKIYHRKNSSMQITYCKYAGTDGFPCTTNEEVNRTYGKLLTIHLKHFNENEPDACISKLFEFIKFNYKRKKKFKLNALSKNQEYYFHILAGFSQSL